MLDEKRDRSDLYQPLGIEALSDPNPTFDRLRVDAPVFWHGDLFAWVLSRHRDCRRVLHNPETFTRDRRKLGRPVPQDALTIQLLDPPDQVPLRLALFRAIRRVDISFACREAREELERRLSDQPLGRTFDFMSSVAEPTAMRFASLVVGVPDFGPGGYSSIFLRLTRAMDSALDPERHDAGVEATKELVDLVQRAEPGAAKGTLIHELHAAPGVGEMPVAYVRNTIAATFNAAYSTAYSSMGSLLALALQRPGLARQAMELGKASLSLQEMLRFTSPAQSTRRYATRDTVLGGELIRQNDPILTLIAAANRDPEVFECPGDLMLDRSPNPHLGFGGGPHRCVGAFPASAFLETFLHSLADFESTLTQPEAATWLDTFTLRCLHRFPIAVRGSEAADRLGSQ